VYSQHLQPSALFSVHFHHTVPLYI